jgi:hypothetical protein
VQLIEQLSTASIRQRLEHCVHHEATICNRMVACQAPSATAGRLHPDRGKSEARSVNDGAKAFACK